MKPKALDLFCGAGGATKGLQMAGFHVTGVDINPQPRYVGDCFRIADALRYLAEMGHLFDLIWAGPICQGYTLMNNRYPEQRGAHERLIPETRAALESCGRPFVIENVIGSPIRRMVKLCGTMFGLGVVRHRLFESNFVILQPSCQCYKWRGHVGVYGDHPDGGTRGRTCAAETRRLDRGSKHGDGH